MADHPIPMSGPMVEAILAGQKTQTRRVVKCPALEFAGGRGDDRNDPYHWDTGLYDKGWGESEPLMLSDLPCPYGVPGDRLWVRETWAALSQGSYEPVDKPDEWGFRHWHYDMRYRANGDRFTDTETRGFKWRPSRFMPRWACRLWLKVEHVWPEPVQNITTEDIWAEGVKVPVSEDGGVLWRMAPGNAAGNVPASYLPGRLHPDQPPVTTDEVARAHFADLWDSLNAKRGHPWEADDWVWVVEFERCET